MKRKLACLADENAKLKQQFANGQTVSGQLRIAMSDHFSYFNSKFNVELCKTKAIGAVVRRGGSVIEQGPGWVDLKLGEKAVMVECDLLRLAPLAGHDQGDFRVGLVIVTGYVTGSNQGILDLAALLQSEIAPP